MVIRGVGPIVGISLVVLGLMVSLSTAVFQYDVTFSEYGGAIIVSREELNIGEARVARAGSTITEAGTSSPVNMSSSSPLPLASTGVPKGNWYCRVDVYSKSGTPADTVFRLELYRWSSTISDYTFVGTLYIRSTSSPSTSDGVRLYFNIGDLPASSEAFMVVASRA